MPATLGEGEANEPVLTTTENDIFVARFEP